MRNLNCLILGLFIFIALTACAPPAGKENPKVYCPACGAELDALFQKQF